MALLQEIVYKKRIGRFRDYGISEKLYCKIFRQAFERIVIICQKILYLIGVVLIDIRPVSLTS